MAKNIKETAAEKIEVIDQIEEKGNRKGLVLWLAIPAVVLTIGAAAFFVTRRISRRHDA